MADNVTVDNGSGTDYTVSTDDAGAAGQVQRVKLAYSADGVATHVTADADGLLVNLGANNDVTVSGVSTAANQSTIIGHLDGVEGLLTTIDADTGGIATSVATVAGAVAGTEMQVDIVSSAAVPVTDNSGSLTVDDGGLSLTVDGTVAVSGTVAVTDNSGSLTVDAPVATPVFVRLSDGSSAIATLPVSLASVPSHAVTNAGTFAVQVSSIAAGTNNIGDVDVLTLPNVTLAAGTNTNEVVGDAAEDAALAGNPVRIGGRASQARPTAMSANGDVVTPWYDLAGALHTVPGAATTATLSNVASSASSTSLLSASTSRKGVIVHNDSTQILYVKYGATASTSSYTYKVPSDATWEMPQPIYTGAIDGIWASANGNARITELT